MIKEVDMSFIFNSPNSEYLFREYFNEGTTGLISEYKVNKETYYTLEANGLLDVFAVIDNDRLVGFIIASTSESPHYSKLITTIMSIYVLPKYRKFGTAKKLLQCIEECAKERQSSAVMVSSPIHSVFGKFVTKFGYKERNILYGKDISEFN